MTGRLAVAAWLVGLLMLPAAAFTQSRPTVKIVYPREGHVLAPVDSEFVIGQALGATSLRINGVETKLYDSGAFLGWIPITPGDFTITVEARNEAGRSTAERTIEVIAPSRDTPQEHRPFALEGTMVGENIHLPLDLALLAPQVLPDRL